MQVGIPASEVEAEVLPFHKVHEIAARGMGSETINLAKADVGLVIGTCWGSWTLS